MKNSSDFRAVARESLKGKWGLAILAGLLASLFWGDNFNGFSFDVKNTPSVDSKNLEKYIAQFLNITDYSHMIKAIVIIMCVTFILFFIYSLVGSIIKVGYSKFNLQLIDDDNPHIISLFSYFRYWKNIISAYILEFIYILVGLILLIIPGIIALYSYSMTRYILAENPEYTATQALERSKELMTGNRLRLFYLQVSFIGWEILSALTFGIGDLWLKPYKHTSYAAFYKEISNTQM